MSDSRPAESDLEALATLKADYEDFKSTILNRAQRRPTGDIEPTLRATPKPDTIFLTGQTLNRADYPALWQWAQDNGAVTENAFGAGDGSTTFTVPNMAGRTLIGAGALSVYNYPLGLSFGAEQRTLTLENMPAHNHGAIDNHQHYMDTGSAGGHTGHPGSTFKGAAGATYNLVDYYDNNQGSHQHDGYTSYSGGHTHNSEGSGTAVDQHQPSFVVNYMMWI